MTLSLYDRKCVVLVGRPPPDDFVQTVPEALRIEGLRVSFKIEKDNKPQPNCAEVSITNLSEKSRSSLQAKGVRVILQAGYAGNFGQIFSGDVRYASHTREGANWVTKLQCGDGERAYQFARISESYKSGTTLGAIVTKTIEALQLDPGNAKEKLASLSAQFVSGYTQHGKASTELTGLLEPIGFSWSIQDGRVELLGPTDTLKGEVVVLSPSSGLIGSPEHGTPSKKKSAGTVKLKALLQSTIRPGSRIVVDSATVKGTLRVERLVHAGDTHGQDWYTEMEAVPTA